MKSCRWQAFCEGPHGRKPLVSLENVLIIGAILVAHPDLPHQDWLASGEELFQHRDDQFPRGLEPGADGQLSRFSPPCWPPYYSWRWSWSRQPPTCSGTKSYNWTTYPGILLALGMSAGGFQGWIPSARRWRWQSADRSCSVFRLVSRGRRRRRQAARHAGAFLGPEEGNSSHALDLRARGLHGTDPLDLARRAGAVGPPRPAADRRPAAAGPLEPLADEERRSSKAPFVSGPRRLGGRRDCAIWIDGSF